MATTTAKRKINKESLPELRLKAALFDQFVEFIEDAYLGQLMAKSEKQRSIPLSRAKKLLAD